MNLKYIFYILLFFSFIIVFSNYLYGQENQFKDKNCYFSFMLGTGVDSFCISVGYDKILIKNFHSTFPYFISIGLLTFFQTINYKYMDLHKYNIGFTFLIKINYIEFLDIIGDSMGYIGTGFALFFYEVSNLNNLSNNKINSGTSIVIGNVFDIVSNIGFNIELCFIIDYYLRIIVFANIGLFIILRL